MVKNLKNIFVTFCSLFIVLLPMALVATPVMAASPTGAEGGGSVNIGANLCNGADLSLPTDATNSPSCDNSSASTGSFQNLLTKIVNVFTVVVGVIALIMIIVGGARYITSGGDTSRVGQAKTTIIYALIGLVVVVLAQLIVHFVLNQASQING